MCFEKRLFFHGERRCKNNCLYCFSSFNDTIKENVLSSRTNCEHTFVYPICDSEILDQEASFFSDVLEKFSGGSSVISISTKNIWPEGMLQAIKNFNSQNKSGFIKLSICFSCKTMIEEIEPMAAQYKERRAFLQKIVDYDIPTCVIIKPILPFVDYREYVSIVDDCGEHCADFVLGHLYVDKSTSFFRERIEGKYQTINKYCAWLGRNCLSVMDDKYGRLMDYIQKCGYRAFHSDREFLEYKREQHAAK